MNFFLAIAIGFSLIFSPLFSGQLYAQVVLEASGSARTQPAHVQYDLPYPGILPGHPLYVLKVLRDRLVGFLINDSLKKAEFSLLQSDKKLFASMMLFEEQSDDQLALDTLSKSINYMHTAVSEADRAQTMGKDTGPIAGQIKDSVKKHIEVMKNLMTSEQPQKKNIEQELKRLQLIEKTHLSNFP